MTTLNRLFKKGLLGREKEVKTYRYTPKYSRAGILREAAGGALRESLEASRSSLLPLSYIIEIVAERDAQLLDELARAI